VSLLSNRRFAVGLWPHGITVSDRSWQKPDMAMQEYRGNSGGGENAPWEAGLAALERWIADIGPRKAASDVVVSNQYVHYMVLPWSKELRDDSEWRALAKARVDLMWGNSDSLDIRLDRMRFGNSRLVCAMDGELKQQLLSLRRNHSHTVISIQPHFISVFNSLAPDIGIAPTMIVVTERHSATIGAIDRGAWRHIRTLPVRHGDSHEMEAVVHRERLLLGLPADAAVLYGGGHDGPSPSSAVTDLVQE
jgi:hypothetical protein